MRTVPRGLLHLGVAAVLLWLLWPERFTVNMPSAIGGWFRSAPTTDSLRNRIRLPDGFSIALYASGLTDAHMLRFTEAGDLLVRARFSRR